MDKTFYMVPFVMLAAWTSVLVARGILRRDTPLQILNDSVLSVVVTLMFLGELVTRWWIPLSIAGAALLVRIVSIIARPRTS
jgi:hypothetical protein